MDFVEAHDFARFVFVAEVILLNRGGYCGDPLRLDPEFYLQEVLTVAPTCLRRAPDVRRGDPDLPPPNRKAVGVSEVGGNSFGWRTAASACRVAPCVLVAFRKLWRAGPLARRRGENRYPLRRSGDPVA